MDEDLGKMLRRSKLAQPEMVKVRFLLTAEHYVSNTMWSQIHAQQKCVSSRSQTSEYPDQQLRSCEDCRLWTWKDHRIKVDNHVEGNWDSLVQISWIALGNNEVRSISRYLVHRMHLLWTGWRKSAFPNWVRNWTNLLNNEVFGDSTHLRVVLNHKLPLFQSTVIPI